MKKKLSLFSLGLLIIAAIDSIRNLPASALFGSSLIFFFLFAAVIFLIPIALISAQMTAQYPDKGGVYHWVKQAFGEKFAFLAILLQWINTIIWYPTILSFIAGTLAYLLDPKLANNPQYLAAMILSIFWALTLISFKGIHFSAKINNICALLGTIFPMTLLIVFGGLWVIFGQPIQIKFSWSEIFPNFDYFENFTSLTAVMASYLGMELAGVHITEVRNPQKNFPKVLLLSAAFILLTMLLGSLSIAFVIPEKEINLVAGVVQVFDRFFSEFGLSSLTPFIALAIVLGSTGGIINWLTSPAKGLFEAAELGYLPKIFQKKNQQDVPTMIMLLQAVIVTIVCLSFIFLKSVNTFYWFLTALSTNLYMMMYILLFASAIKLNYRHAFKDCTFKLSSSRFGLKFLAILGIFGCALTVIVGFFPPRELMISDLLSYCLWMMISMIASIAFSLLFFAYKKKET